MRKTLKFAGNETSRRMGPKCTHRANAKHATIVWVEKKQRCRRRYDDLTFKIAVLLSQTIHSCFAIAFRTQASTRIGIEFRTKSLSYVTDDDNGVHCTCVWDDMMVACYGGKEELKSVSKLQTWIELRPHSYCSDKQRTQSWAGCSRTI